jgi:hypothetical protein
MKCLCCSYTTIQVKRITINLQNHSAINCGNKRPVTIENLYEYRTLLRNVAIF